MIPLRDTQPSSSFPFVTLAIIAMNVMVFLHQIMLPQPEVNVFIARYGIIPDQLQYQDVITSMFLHGGWMHLIGNMWFLWIFGDNIEDILGHGKFALFYLLCGIGAALVHIILNPYSRIPTVGASGAIAGVMGAYMIKFPHSRIFTLIPIFFFITTAEIPAFLMLIYWFAIQIFNGIGSIGYSQIQQGGVAWFAHVGGFVAGILLVILLRTRQRYRYRRDLTW